MLVALLELVSRLSVVVDRLQPSDQCEPDVLTSLVPLALCTVPAFDSQSVASTPRVAGHEHGQGVLLTK